MHVCALLMNVISQGTGTTSSTQSFTISKRAGVLKMLEFGFNLKSSAFKNIIGNHKAWKYILKCRQKNTQNHMTTDTRI